MVRKKIIKRVTCTFAFAEVGTEEGAGVEVGDVALYTWKS